MSVHIRRARAEDFDEILKINSESSPHVAQLNDEDLCQVAALASIAYICALSKPILVVIRT